MLPWVYNWWWEWLENDENDDDDDDAQKGERPYSGYTVHLCSSQWLRCSLRTSCLGVWVLGSCIPDSAASRTGCCIRSIRSTRPILRQLRLRIYTHVWTERSPDILHVYSPVQRSEKHRGYFRAWLTFILDIIRELNILRYVYAICWFIFLVFWKKRKSSSCPYFTNKAGFWTWFA